MHPRPVWLSSAYTASYFSGIYLRTAQGNYIPLSLRSFVLLSKKEYKNNVTKNDSVTRQTINLPISLFLLLFFLVLENQVVFRIFVSELIF